MRILFSCAIFCLSFLLLHTFGESKFQQRPFVKNLSLKESYSLGKEKLYYPSISANTMNTKDTLKATNDGTTLKRSLWKISLGLWGVLQVISVLANAIKRLYPIAVQPFIQNDMTPAQWAMYAVFVLIMAYTEGYRGFQLKFSPMVVERAFSLVDHPSILNYFLAGPYSMGMFGADKKRMVVSWAITIGVFALVTIVKRFPYPYRSIVDAGVVVGLSYGTLSIVFLTAKHLLGGKVKVPTPRTVPFEKTK